MRYQKDSAIKDNYWDEFIQLSFNWRVFSLILFFIGIQVTDSPAQNQKYTLTKEWSFEVFPLPGNENSNTVTAIVQDSLGYLWFGSFYGLHRYDGVQFKTFSHDPWDSTSISDNRIESMLVDHAGDLWIGTAAGGLNRYTHADERFTRYPASIQFPDQEGYDMILSLAEDSIGNIWVGTRETGIYRLDPSRTAFTSYKHDPEDPNSLSDWHTNMLYIDRRGVLWIGTGAPWWPTENGGLNRYNPETDNFTRYLHNANDSSTLRYKAVWSAVEDLQGQFWVGTEDDGLHLMDRSSGTFQHFPFDPAHPEQLSTQSFVGSNIPSIGLRSLKIDKKGQIWGLNHGGLIVFDPVRKRLQRYGVGKEREPGCVPSAFLRDMHQARDGTVWLAGVFPGNVIRAKKNIQAYEYKDLTPYLDHQPEISSFYEDFKGDLWVGGSGPLLLRIDRLTGLPTRILHKRSSGDSAPDYGKITNLFQDQSGTLWIVKGGIYRLHQGGTLWIMKGGLYRLHQDGQHYTLVLDQSQIGGIMTINEDESGQLWMGTPEGLVRYRQQPDSLRWFLSNENDPSSLANPSVFNLFTDSKGRFWVMGGRSRDINFKSRAPNEGFLDQLNTADEKLIHHLSSKKGQLMGRGPFTMVEDEKGNLWFASYQGGLYRYQPETREYTSFNPRQGNLPEIHIHWLLKDSKGILWIGGLKTVYRLDPENGQYRSYDFFASKPGGNSLNLALINQEDALMFVWGNGYYVFRPDLLEESQPELLLSDLWVGEEKILPGSGPILSDLICQTQEIVLKHHQNTFSIGLRNFHYTDPTHNRTEYKLEPYDEKWKELGASQQAAFQKVLPGTYTFRARGFSSGGVKSEEKTLTIRILPPWWQTTWAYFLYAAIALISILTLYRFQLNRQLAAAETRRLQELDEVKTKLYTNITHEFRTPLTVILGMGSKVLEQPKEWFHEGMHAILRNGEHLLNLVNQMLDLSKLETGSMQLNRQQSNVIFYLKYLVEAFQAFAVAKGIDIHFLPRTNMLMMDFDPDKLSKIVQNLLSNAVKHTPKGGNIYVQAWQEAECLMLVIKDTGEGIPEAALPFLFDRFYQVSSSGKGATGGTGIGLALSKELVGLMNGTIEVKSTVQKGTEFLVKLPITRTAELKEITLSKEPVVIPPLTNTLAEQAVESSELPTVLIIEDQQDVARYIASCIDQDYQVLWAPDGKAGIEKAIEFVPDIIISDVMMPEKDGFQVTATLKQDIRTSHIPIVLLTAKADVASRLEGLEQGADAYLSKPFQAEELEVRLRKLIELRRMLQEQYAVSAGAAHTSGALHTGYPLEDTFLQKFRQVIVEHMSDEHFGTPQLLKALGMSRTQLHNKLKALTGKSTSHVIRSIRLQQAKELLENTELNVSEVALKVGFNSLTYFSSSFSEEFGVPPSEIRK